MHSPRSTPARLWVFPQQPLSAALDNQWLQSAGYEPCRIHLALPVPGHRGKPAGFKDAVLKHAQTATWPTSVRRVCPPAKRTRTDSPGPTSWLPIAEGLMTCSTRSAPQPTTPRTHLFRIHPSLVAHARALSSARRRDTPRRCPCPNGWRDDRPDSKNLNGATPFSCPVPRAVLRTSSCMPRPVQNTPPWP